MPRPRALVCLAAAVLLSALLGPPLRAQQAPRDTDGASALAPLSQRLASDSRCERLAAMRELSRLEALPAGALPLVRQGLQDPDLAVRLTAAAALARAPSLSGDLAAVTRTALQDPSPLVRQFGVRALGCIPGASEAAPELPGMVAQDTEPAVRELAATTLRRLQGAGSGARGVHSGEPTGVGGAEPDAAGAPIGPVVPSGGAGRATSGPATAPGGRQSPGGTTVPGSATLSVFIARLSDPDPELRLQAAEALGKMGPAAITALPALQRALADPDARVHLKAEWAIAQIWRPRPPRSDEPAGPPPADRVYFLTDIVIGCDEHGPQLQDEITCQSPSGTGDLFAFTTLSYLDLPELARYRADAARRGLPADRPLDELVSADPDWEELAPRFPFYKRYLLDHVVAVTCNGQTRFLHRRYDARGEVHEWGGGEHWGLENGKHKAVVQIFTIEGFRLRFEFEFVFQRDGSVPAHLAALRGPADVGANERALIAELEEEDKPIAGLIADLSAPSASKRSWAAQKLARYGREAGAALGALEATTRDADAEMAVTAIENRGDPDREALEEPRRERARRLAGLAGTLWVTLRDLVRYAGATTDTALPYVQDAANALRAGHDLYPPGLANNATIQELAYGYHVLCDAVAWPSVLEAMVFYEEALQSIFPTSTSFWDRQAWSGWAAAWHQLARTAISQRNDVSRFWLYQEHWLQRSADLVDVASGRPLELGTSNDRDTWPQPGWWRSEWDDVLPPDLPEYEPPEAPQPAVAEGDDPADVLDDLEDILQDIDRDRALEKRWADGLSGSLETAERKKKDAVELLRAQAEMAGAIRARLRNLRGILARTPQVESDTWLEAAMKLGIETWNDAWGPRPQPTERASEVVRRLIADLTKQHERILQEQDSLINDVLTTYYDGIILEAEAKGAKVQVEANRDTATRIMKDTQELRALAKTELYLASGQGDKFRAAAREAIAAGAYELDVRFMEATYFHQNGDVRHALHGYRKVAELAAQGQESAPLTAAQAQGLVTAEKATLGDRARAMAWALEHAYLKAIDAKAEGEAAELRGELDDRLSKGGEKGWLGSVIGFLKVGYVSSLSAVTGREDALEGLASQFQTDVAKQHCGVLLLQSLHERGVPLDGLDRLSNDAFLKLIATAYPEAGRNLDPDDALRMRAAIKAAYANGDVRRLVDVPAQMLDVDTGTPYFEKADYQETALEWWGDTINLANVLTWLGPAAAWRVGGKVAWCPNWGWIGEARQAGAAVVTAKDAVAGALGLSRLPAMLSQSKPGQLLVEQFSRFFARSTWIEERGLDMAMQLAVGKVGEATGGTLGVLSGSDGRAEAEAGRLFAELFAAWGAGDADVMKRIMLEHGITTAHLRSLIQAAEESAASARAASELGTQHSRDLRRALDEIGEAAPSAEARAALRNAGDDVKRMLDEASAQFQRGEPGLGWDRLEELRIAREAYAAAEAGASAEARAWRELLDERIEEWAARTKQAAQAAQEMGAVPGTRQVGRAPAEDAPVSFRQQSSRLTEDLDALVVRGEYDAALIGCHQRLGLLRQLGASDTPQVKALAEKARRVRAIVETRKRFASAPASPDDGHARPVTSDYVATLDADPGVAKVRMALPGEEATYSDPYWVWRKTEKGLEKDGVFKGSGEGFSNHYDLRAEEVYASFGEVAGVDVPACVRAEMNIGGQMREGIYVRNARGTCLKYMSREAQVALKPQITRDRVLAALLGDHDRHMGNYLVTADGKLISIDHGMADVCGRSLGEDSPLADDAAFREAMRRRVVDLGRGRNYALTYLDEHITIEDMLPTIRKLQEFCDDPTRLRKLLEKHLSGMELEDALRVIPGRARVLEDVMRECFGSLDDLKPIPVPTAANGVGAARHAAATQCSVPLAA